MWGDILSTLGVFSTIGGYHDARGGYHEYRGGVFSTVGEKSFVILVCYSSTPMVLMVSSTCMISPKVLNIPTVLKISTHAS